LPSNEKYRQAVVRQRPLVCVFGEKIKKEKKIENFFNLPLDSDML